MSQRSINVLIVDDETSIQDSFSKILKLDGYAVESAGDGKDALSKAMTLSFDVFLIDIRLPDIEGTDLLKQLQKINPSAIKIMITGMPSAENAIKSLNIGANSFLTKPLDPAVLRRTIKESLNKKP